ncbi:cytochrome c oxidase accessory protein CcoG [Franzmannia qiaohouensis]|uniref:Cytochrome c oxidase accessory protein CcoG n=1 Tax=Franzmannia qiaohouensis TaxID=1329370 RepID=A0ABU1HBL1_9GAMM|nr:cytochrome c oxidase accessory protein CcoG [Halomonas qiaohouensis]MDR5904677.1 cytochrome c oxidase accessory protein CcoG [Halomonas qiaohouensis]
MSERIPSRDVTPDPAVGQHPPVSVQQNMYASRQHIYVREIKGLFQRLRRSANWVLMLLFFGMPWLTWGGRPAVWFDLPAREFHILGGTFYPQEFMLLSWLLIICAFGLFLITVFAGRVWCGYTCPQSVWTFLYIWVEHRLEGTRNRRIKLDRQPFSVDKAWRKTAKHIVWLMIALATGVTFVGYFTPIRELVVALPTLEAHGWAYFWVGFFVVFTYLNAGWLREQVCIYMCPYARFQSVMFDRDTLIVSYDTARGEPRGSRKRDADPKAQGLGDCIDCELCVQVCPTGIDIRDGLQYECISCAACIDACDSVMDRMGYPRGLVRYTTERALEGGKTHILRPRLAGYLAALLVMMGLFAWALGERVPLEFDLERDRNSLYQQTRDGRISNVYTLNVRNLDDREHIYRIYVDGPEGLTLVGNDTLRIGANSSRIAAIELTLDPEQIDMPSKTIEVRLVSQSDASISQTRESRFIGQIRR